MYVYIFVFPSLHTSLVVSTCLSLCLLACLGLSLWFCKLVHLIFCVLVVRFWTYECGLFVFFQCAAFGLVVSLFRDLGLLFHVICHFCVLLWFWIVCLCFVLIIMGCSLLLSHFLFIALILDPGLSLTSQGCLRCGNQGKLYLPGVSSHLLASNLIIQL